MPDEFFAYIGAGRIASALPPKKSRPVLTRSTPLPLLSAEAIGLDDRDRTVGGEPSHTLDFVDTAARLLRSGHPYHAWRLIDRVTRVYQLKSVDLTLLQAKALEHCRQHNAAVELLFNARRRFPDNDTLIAYLLELLEAHPLPPNPASRQLAWAALARHDQPVDVLRAARILTRFKDAPVGACRFDGETLSGWLLNAERQPPLTVVLDGIDYTLKPFLATPLLNRNGLGGERDGFSFKLPNRPRHIRVHLANKDLAGSPLVFSGASDVASSGDAALTIAEQDGAVDVIVPVYKGYAETKACLKSVLTAANRTAYRLIVVDDASPDPLLATYLRKLADQGRITLVKQAVNAGFVQSVDRGLRLGPHRDAILLNADTVVHGDWLDRLRDAAYLANDIGTVTPFSNNGELVSYPTPMRAWALPKPAVLQRLDRLCAELPADNIVDIPVGVGFCLYIKRQCLTEAGGFDSRMIERGYGEDTEFCLRAERRGWRNVCTPRVFVGHSGSVSFGTEKADLAAKNVAKIYARYPDHSDQYDRFLSEDPLRPIRLALQRQFLPMRSGKRAELALLPTTQPGDLRGEWLAQGLSQTATFTLQASRAADGALSLSLQSTRTETPLSLHYRWPDDEQPLWQDLSRLNLARIDIYDLADWPFQIGPGLIELAIPYRIFLSDYAAYCPRITLTRPNAAFCGDPPNITACVECIDRYGSRLPDLNSPADLRQGSRQLLANASGVYLASRDGLNRFRRRFPEVRFRYRAPNRASDRDTAENIPPLPRDRHLRIAVIQAAPGGDDFEALLKMSRWLAARRLNAELIVFGESVDDGALLATGRAWVVGALAYREIPRMLALHRCSLILDASRWPQIEPIAWRLAKTCGLPIAAPAIGTYADLLDPTAGDIPLAPDATAENWLNAVLSAHPAISP